MTNRFSCAMLIHIKAGRVGFGGFVWRILCEMRKGFDEESDLSKASQDKKGSTKNAKDYGVTPLVSSIRMQRIEHERC